MCTNCFAEAARFTCDASPAPGPRATRRRTLDWLAAGGLAALLAGQGGAARAEALADDTVRIGYLPITDAAALLVAYAKGFFQDEGLKAERPTLIRGWAPMVEAFSAAKFNLVHLLFPLPIWMRYNNQVPVKLVAWAHVNGSALTVGPHTGIQSIADLGGKTVAVPFWYSIHNILLQKALTSAGIEPVLGGTPGPKQCALVILEPPAMLPALAASKIDAYIVAEPFNAMGELALGARILRFSGDIWKNHPCCVACMHEPMITANPQWAQKVVNALVRAEAYIPANRAEVAQLLSRDGQGYLPMPAAAIERALTLYAQNPAYLQDGAIQHPGWHDQRIDFSPYPYASATHLVVDWLKQTKVAGDNAFLAKLDPAFVQADLVDDRFVRAAMAKYPIAGLPPVFTREEVVAL
jgi:NitT/TauT family transport system substrate-binding protein